MPDFEVMPVGTRRAMGDAMGLFRSFGAVHQSRLDRALQAGRNGHAHAHKAGVCIGIADRLEALLKQPG